MEATVRTLPTKVLEDQISKLFDQFMEENSKDQVDPNLVLKIQEKLKIFTDESTRRSNTPKSDRVVHAQAQNVSVSYEQNRRFREVADYCSKLTQFGPGSNVTTFLKDCQVIFDMAVANSEGTKLEPEFCRRIMMQFSSDYASAANDFSARSPLTTFSSLKSYLRETYESKTSAYMHYQLFDSMEKSPTESISDFAIRVDRTKREVGAIVFDKFSRHQKNLVKKENEAEKTEMSAQDLLDFMAGQIVLRSLKSDKEAYNHLVASDLDKCWNASSIATKAAYFVTNRSKSDPMFPDPDPKVNFARNKQQSRPKQKSDSSGQNQKYAHPCPYEIRKRCIRRNSCKFDHDPEKIRSFRESIEVSDVRKGNNRGNQNSGNKEKRSWKNSANVNFAEQNEQCADLDQISALPGFQ